MEKPLHTFLQSRIIAQLDVTKLLVWILQISQCILGGCFEWELLWLKFIRYGKLHTAEGDR